MYPRVEINLDKIKYNTKTLVKMCKDEGIKVAGVTKVFYAEPNIVKAYVEGGIDYIGDSRIENLAKLEKFDLPKILLRLPMISQAYEVVKYADISLNSEYATIKELSKAAKKIGKVHKIILMVDLGDLREGYFKEEEIYEVVGKIIKLDGVEIIGIGTNLTCYGGVIPGEKNLERLCSIAETIEEKYDIKLDIISGGNSSSLHLVEKKNMPKKINQLRLGESLVLGRETAFGNRIDGTYEDAFKLVVEVIELKEKPSVPIGEIGMDAFGNKPTFVDRGVRKRMICAIGKQDIDISDIIPDDKDIIILGGSSDHILLDVTDCDKDYCVGDKISFNLSYGGILKSMTSQYVHKEYVSNK